MEDLARKLFYYEKIKKQEKSAVLQKFNHFFFKTGTFPGTNDLAIVPSLV